MSPAHHVRLEAPHSNRRDLANVRKLSYYLWEYRGRVILALACLINQSKILLVPVGLVAAYGALRICSSLFNELRDSLFSRVRYRAMHQLSIRVLSQPLQNFVW